MTEEMYVKLSTGYNGGEVVEVLEILDDVHNSSNILLILKVRIVGTNRHKYSLVSVPKDEYGNIRTTNPTQMELL